MPIRLAIAVAGLATAIAGCTQGPRTHTIVMKNFGFEPATLTVAVGDTVAWSNADLVPHTATATDAAWDSKSIAASAGWHMVSSTPGAHEYYCVFHPGMKGTIVVR